MAIPIANIRAQYAANAKDLRETATKARAVYPKKVRGRDAVKWEERASVFEFILTLDDDDLAVWFRNCMSASGRAENAALYELCNA
jgi:hypothetical protein